MDVIISVCPSKIPRSGFRKHLIRASKRPPLRKTAIFVSVFPCFSNGKWRAVFGSAGVKNQHRHFLSTLLLPAGTLGVESVYMRRGISGSHRLADQPHTFDVFVGVYGGYGGEGGIRTLEAPCGHLYDFQSYSLGLSDTSPREWGRRANHERAMRSFVYHGRRRNVSPPSQSRLDFYVFFFDDSKHVRKEVILI